jgi:hypothetical protein
VGFTWLCTIHPYKYFSHQFFNLKRKLKFHVSLS